MLRLSDVAVDLGGFALRVDSLRVASGEYLVVLGPNGAGKTVLLETIAGLHPVRKGCIEFRDAAARLDGSAFSGHAGEDWTDVTASPPEKRRVGFVYQDYLLFPHLSVGDNIGFGLRGRVPAAERGRRVREAATLTGVDGLLGRRVSGLSGGEQQKVTLARALAIRPRLLLLDEPLAALDRSARRQMAGDVRKLCRDLGVTVLHVTHSLEEAVSLGDRVAVLAGGKMLQIGSPGELLRAPKNRRVAELMGCENLLFGRLSGSMVFVAGGPTLEVSAGADGLAGDGASGDTIVALRAEDLAVETALGSGAPAAQFPGSQPLAAQPPVPQAPAPRPNLFLARVEMVEPGPAHWTVRARYAGPAPADAPRSRLSEPPCVFTIFVMPPEFARLGLLPGSSILVHIDPRRVCICTA